MTHTAPVATEREWELLDIIHNINSRGRVHGGDHIRLLKLGIDLEDLSAGMGTQEDNDISQGKYTDWLALWALRRWASESRGLIEKRRHAPDNN